MKKITPCLWFDSGAEEAAAYYVSVFPNSKILTSETYLTETPSNKPIGSVMDVIVSLNGSEFMLLNGGPYFKMTEAVSFMIECETDEEVAHYYEMLSAVPEAEICGWAKDKYGVSWQILPPGFNELMGMGDDETKKRRMEALMEMKRLDMEVLRQA